MNTVEYVDAYTWHGREGNLENAFKYKVGFVILDPEKDVEGPALFSRTSGKFFGVLDSVI